jgi:hypothetical protein
MVQLKFVDKTKTHFVLNNFLNFENRAVYEIMWKKHCRTEQVTDDSIIRCTRITFWILKATNTRSEHATLIAFPW